MVLEELAARLNDGGYKNWLKAGSCLMLLRDGLHLFISHHSRAFHADLLNQHALLRKPCESSACRPRDNQLSSPCRPCSEWQTVILRHHRQPRPAVHWDNCFPPLWRTDHWEVAKAYMPRGQARVKGADQCDASALLNLMNCCGCFHFVHQKCVTEVIRHRNELMHSSDLRVRDEWMRRFQAALINLLKQFSDVPQMQKARRQIEEMLSVDLSVCVSGLDQMDSARLECGPVDRIPWETSGNLISQWEAELIQEKLQELLHAAPDDDDDAKKQDAEQLKRLGGFLQANRDLGERFSAELQAINSLEARG